MSRIALFALVSVSIFAVRVFADAPASSMRHPLRDMVTYDSLRMIRLVQKELNIKEQDDEIFLTQAAQVLAQTVLVQPEFSAREAGLRELRGKLEPEDLPVVMKKATDMLLAMAVSENPIDQATAMVALTNLVVEARASKKVELRENIQKIANAHLSLGEEARKYAQEPLQKVISPSQEAEAALAL